MLDEEKDVMEEIFLKLPEVCKVFWDSILDYRFTQVQTSADYLLEYQNQYEKCHGHAYITGYLRCGERFLRRNAKNRYCTMLCDARNDYISAIVRRAYLEADGRRDTA